MALTRGKYRRLSVDLERSTYQRFHLLIDGCGCSKVEIIRRLIEMALADQNLVSSLLSRNDNQLSRLLKVK